MRNPSKHPMRLNLSGSDVRYMLHSLHPQHTLACGLRGGTSIEKENSTLNVDVGNWVLDPLRIH